MSQRSKTKRRTTRDKAPLYRKVNTRTHGVCHGNGSDFRHQRNTKAERRAEADGVSRGKMRDNHQHGLDYTPLFRYLQARVGRAWAPVEAEARARVLHPEMIALMVSPQRAGADAFVRAGEASYWTRLYVDAEGVLQPVAPAFSIEDFYPLCPCCTHSLNGTRVENAFPGTPEAYGIWNALSARYSIPDDAD